MPCDINQLFLFLACSITPVLIVKTYVWIVKVYSYCNRQTYRQICIFYFVIQSLGVCVLSGTRNPTWEGPPLRYYISVVMPSVTVEALTSGTEVLHQDFGKHQPDFLTVPFVYRADRPQLNRKGLVCVWSINPKVCQTQSCSKRLLRAGSQAWSPQRHLWLTEWRRFITAQFGIQFAVFSLIRWQLVKKILMYKDVYIRWWNEPSVHQTIKLQFLIGQAVNCAVKQDVNKCEVKQAR